MIGPGPGGCLLLLLLLLCDNAQGYVRSYKGFDDCGYNGWTCTLLPDGTHDIKYRCLSTPSLTARLWMWTARIPSTATSLTIQDCSHVELHVDCTAGIRAYNLRTLNVVNVTMLEFLKPIKPRIFLHDNDQVAQMPETLVVRDTTVSRLYSGMFEKPAGRCKYPSLVVKKITFDNVQVRNVEREGLYVNDIDSFYWNNVKVYNQESGGVAISTGKQADELVKISNCYFTTMMTYGLNISSSQVIIERNEIMRIEKQGIIVESQSFTFANNTVEVVESDAFQVLSANITIKNNIVKELHTNALQNISPGFFSTKALKASKYSYKFVDNIIYNMNVGAVHMDWQAYSSLCSAVKVNHNQFNCTCANSKWLKFLSGLGEQLNGYKSFYEMFLRENNTCYDGCTIDSFSSLCTSPASNFTECVKYGWAETVTEFHFNYTVNETTDEFDNDNVINVTILGPNLTNLETSHLHDNVHDKQDENDNKTPTYVWILFYTVIILVVAVSLGFFSHKSLKVYKASRQVVQVRRMNNEDDDMVAVLE